MRKSILVAAGLSLAAAPVAQAQLQAGQWAPEIEARDWLNDPPGTSLADLRGRVVYLEFWRTN